MKPNILTQAVLFGCIIASSITLAHAKTAETAPSPAEKTPVTSIGDSLIRVNVTAQGYNYYQPWEKGKPGTRRGLGVFLKDNKILVTAQMVANATYVELEKPQSGEKPPAKWSLPITKRTLP